MEEIDLSIPDHLDWSNAARISEDCCSRHGLQITQRGTLIKYRECLHWHLKEGKQRGVLELTLWPRGNRIWFKIQSGRRAPWIGDLLPELKRCIESNLEGLMTGKTRGAD